jgi:hypothetical protein
MATYTLISSNVLTSLQAAVTFGSIPQTFTDLLLKSSTRCATNPSGTVFLELNGVTTADKTNARIVGSGSLGTSAARDTGQNYLTIAVNQNTSASTANTFTSIETYFPSYSTTERKQFYSFSANEENATAAYIAAIANYQSGTSAITQISIIPSAGANFAIGSSFYLYGISNA